MLMFTTNSTATEFCVTSSAGLEFSLAIADSNNQSDVIKITNGVYDVPLSGFVYFSEENFDLDISGGWSEKLGDPCGEQLSGNAFATVLDGNTATRVLFVGIGDDSSLRVASLFFANGFLPQGFGAAGLLVSTGNNHTGEVVIENNAFINNQAGTASAFSIWASEKLTVRNNLFVANSNNTGFTVEILQSDGSGVYFTNNTIYQNSQVVPIPAENQLSGNGNGSGLLLNVNGTSQAFLGNNVFWGNDVSDLQLNGGGFKFLRNNNIDVQTGSADIDFGNISAEPLFEVGLFNYRPAAGSPLINAGVEPLPVVPQPPSFDQNWDVGMQDLVGNDRVQMGGVDMGAVESAQLDIIFSDDFEN